MGRMYAILEPPPVFTGTLAMWEQYLERVKQLPKDADDRAHLMSYAREVIAQKKKEMATRRPAANSARE